MVLEAVLLFSAGFFGGALNSIAGGGSFITFPALLLAGVPAIGANATNTLASLPGYLVGAYIMRHDIAPVRKQLPRLLVTSLIGGVVGAWLLLRTPEARFIEIVPWLLAFATGLFIFGKQIYQGMRRHTAHHHYASMAGTVALTSVLALICIYGGFFNAGLGIITLSYLALAGMSDIRTMTGLKLLISSAVSSIAVVLFIVKGSIYWQQGLVVLLGTLIGGAVSAHLSRKLPQSLVRYFIIMASIMITSWFFYDVYFI